MRKCSCCGNNGHNSRTCNEKGCVKLFGVNIKRSLSLGDLEGYVAKSKNGHVDQDGYVSDDDQSSRERKKGKPWTEEEHRNFLAGLMKLGKGDWRGISRNFVSTRTPTQVASHAQKYFMRRQASAERKKRRSSVFDMTLQEPDPAMSYFAQFSLPKISGVASSEASTAASVALKETVEPQQQNNAAAQITNRFPSLSLDSTPTPTNPTMQSGLPYYITNPYMGSVPGWTAECIRPCQPYMPYDSGRIGKLSPLAAVHPNSLSKPPFPRRFPNQEAPSKRANSLELELKIGQAIPQSPRAANMSPKEASGPIGVLS